MNETKVSTGARRVKVQKGQRSVDGCTFGQRRLRGFQQYKKIENQTIIKEVTRGFSKWCE